MNRLKIIATTIALLFTATLTDAKFVLVVAGNVTNEAGYPVQEAFTIRARNETRAIESESKTTSAGNYKVILSANLSDPKATAAEAGDIIRVSALKADGKVAVSRSYQLKSEDISKAFVTLDLPVETTPSDRVVLAVVGNLKDEQGQPVKEKFTIRVRNETRNLESEGETNPGGNYRVILFADVLADSASTAVEVGDTLHISAWDGDGKTIASRTYQLKSADLESAVVRLDLAVTVSEAETPWDVNSDGGVNIFDLVLVGGQFGQTPPANLAADVNGDGTVNIFDLVTVASHFGESTVSVMRTIAPSGN